MWTKQKLSSIATITMGQSPTSDNYNDIGEGLPFYQGVTDFGRLYPTTNKFSRKYTKTAETGDLLFSVRAPVGDINLATTKSAIGRGVCSISSKFGNNQFLYYLLTSKKKQILSSGNGSVYDAINKPTLENQEFEIPYLPIQRNIASLLSTYDDFIENNEKRIKILEEMAQRLYTEWFVKFHFPGHEKVKLVDSQTSFGMIPEDWQVKNVESVITRIPVGKKYDNKSVLNEGSIPVLDQGKTGIIGFHNEVAGVNASINEPVIVFANHTCYQNLITFPFSAIQNVLPYMPVGQQDIFWLYWTTKDIIQFSDYKGHWPEFVAKKLLVPRIELTDNFGIIVKNIVAIREQLKETNKKVAILRDLLVPQLITGKREVKS